MESFLNHIGIIFTTIGIGLCLCVLAIAYLLYKDTQKREQNADASVKTWTGDERRRSSFWKATNQTPVRDMPFTREEKAAAALQPQTVNKRERMSYAEAIVTLEAIADTLTPPKEVAHEQPNVDGFPFDGTAYHQFKDAMRAHGFVVRFVMATHEIHVIYESPRGGSFTCRKLYSPPREIYPANLLHDKNCILTALWAMRKFKAEEHPPALDAFAYL